MTLSPIDRDLLRRLLDRSGEAWSEFVDRFIGLIAHVVDRTAVDWNLSLDALRRDELIAEVFYALVQRDYAALRHFRGKSSLASYLTVIARRQVCQSLRRDAGAAMQSIDRSEAAQPVAPDRLRWLEDREAIETAIANLPEAEAVAVRMYHLEGRSYREIGERLGLAENSIGPFLSRAREKMGNTLSSS